MANVGPMEIALVLIIALLVFGPKRLPEIGRTLGDGFRQFRESLSGEEEQAPASSAQVAEPSEKPGRKTDA